ncbi:hypothetical protein D3C78_842910 [compost metagenome]
MIERRGRYREAHTAKFGDDPVGAFEGLRTQAATHLRRFVDHRFEAQLHQLVGRHQAGDTGTDNRHFFTVALGRNTAQACGVLDPVVKGEREIRAENSDRFLAIGGVAIVLVHR